MPYGPQNDSKTIPRATAGNLQSFAILGIPSSANYSNYFAGSPRHERRLSPSFNTIARQPTYKFQAPQRGTRSSPFTPPRKRQVRSLLSTSLAWLLSLRGSPPSLRLTRKARPGSARPSLHSSYSPFTRASRSTATLDLPRHGHVPVPRLAPVAPLLVALTPLTGLRVRPPAHVPPTD